MLDTCPNLSEHGPISSKLGLFWAFIGRNQSRIGRLGGVGRCLSESIQTCRILSKEIGPSLADAGPALSDISRVRPQFAQNWAQLGQIKVMWPVSVELCPESANEWSSPGRMWPNVVDSVQHLSTSPQFWSLTVDSGQDCRIQKRVDSGSDFHDCGPHLAALGRIRPTVGRILSDALRVAATQCHLRLCPAQGSREAHLSHAKENLEIGLEEGNARGETEMRRPSPHVHLEPCSSCHRLRVRLHGRAAESGARCPRTKHTNLPIADVSPQRGQAPGGAGIGLRIEKFD